MADGSIVVDAGRKRCPFVLLALKKAMRDADAGSSFELRTIDPQAIEDVEKWSAAMGHTMGEVERGDVIVIRLVKGER